MKILNATCIYATVTAVFTFYCFTRQLAEQKLAEIIVNPFLDYCLRNKKKANILLAVFLGSTFQEFQQPCSVLCVIFCCFNFVRLSTRYSCCTIMHYDYMKYLFKRDYYQRISERALFFHFLMSVFNCGTFLPSSLLSLCRSKHIGTFLVVNNWQFYLLFCLFVCVEVLRPSQQLRSCRAGQLPINTVPGQAYTY